MPRYFFRITQAGIQRPPAEGIELVDDEAAWEEATIACGELIRGTPSSLRPGEHWQMEVSREDHSPIYTLDITGTAHDV